MKLLIFIILITLIVLYLKRNVNIERISYKYTSKSDFEKRTTPCIIHGATEHWGAHKLWSFENFTKRFHNTRFIFADCLKLTEPLIEVILTPNQVRATDVAMCKHPPVMTQGPKWTHIWMSLHIG